MRKPIYIAALFGVAVLSACPASAARLQLPDNEDHAWFVAPDGWRIGQPGDAHRVDTTLIARPIGDVIAMKLGLVRGRVQLFRFHIENAPSNATLLRGEIDGGGVKLKLTW